MARVIKHHPFLIAIPLVSLVVVVTALTGYLLLPDQAEAGAVGLAPLSAVDRGKVNRLRQKMALTNSDLAAMGCTEAQASQVLELAVGWYQSHATTLAANQAQQRQAKRQLRQIYRDMALGETEGAANGQVLEYKGQLANGAQDQQALYEQLIPVVETGLSADQREIWAAARANRRLAQRYRYIPDLTGAQLSALQKLQRSASNIQTSPQAAEAAVLTTHQRKVRQNAQASRQAGMAAVLAAEQALLPESEHESLLEDHDPVEPD